MLERSLRILVVEDHPLLLMTIADMLEDAGFIAEGARDGTEAMARLSSDDAPVDLVVTDIALGGGPNGWAVADHARRRDPQLPLIYLTGHPEAAALGRMVPGALLLAKPIARNHLIAALDQLLFGRAERLAACV